MNGLVLDYLVLQVLSTGHIAYVEKVKRWNCQVVPARVTTSDVVGKTVQRQRRFKIAQEKPIEKSVDQHCGFEHTIVFNRQPLEFLDGCCMSKLSMIGIIL